MRRFLPIDWSDNRAPVGADLAGRFVRRVPLRSPGGTVTIDDTSEPGAWERALRDTPHIDRNLGRDRRASK